METPVISSRSSFESRYDSYDLSRTPMDKSKFCHSKFKHSYGKMQERNNLESIEETPVQPKMSFGKSRIPSNRFKMNLDQGGKSI